MFKKDGAGKLSSFAAFYGAHVPARLCCCSGCMRERGREGEEGRERGREGGGGREGERKAMREREREGARGRKGERQGGRWREGYSVGFFQDSVSS